MNTKTIFFLFLIIGGLWFFNKDDSADKASSVRTQASLSEDEEFASEAPEERPKVVEYKSPEPLELRKTHEQIAQLKRIKEVVTNIYLKNMEFIQSDPIDELNAEIENTDNKDLQELLSQERDWMVVRCGKNFVYYKDCPNNYEVVPYKERIKSQLQSNYNVACKEARDEQCLEMEDQLEKLEYEIPETIEFSYHNFNQELSGILASYLEDGSPSEVSDSGL